MLIITGIFLCYMFTNVCDKMKKILSVTVKNWLGRLFRLVPFILGAFLVTSVIQVSVYESTIKSFQMTTVEQYEESPIDPNLPLWEQPTLLNLTNFRWIMNNESTCKLDSSQEGARVVLALIHTARSHFHERMGIRRSWGSMPMYKNWTLRLAFLLGEPDPAKNSTEDLKELSMERKKLRKEQQKYGDVVIGSFLDSYHNLTYKHMMGYKWALNFCPDAQFVLKCDDDMFIDILRWLDWRTRDLKSVAKNATARIPDLMGFNYGGTPPMRLNTSKWYVSMEEYPETNYPNYCSGWGYGITMGLIRRLYNATSRAKFLWVDDAYATGILLREVKKEKDKPRPNVYFLGNKISGDVKDYKQMCEKQAWYKKRKFKSVTYIDRGSDMEKYMVCMWNKTLYDSKYRFNKKVLF